MSRWNESAAERVLVLTPTGRDGKMICEQLEADGLPCEICADLESLLAGISSGAGAAVIADEALSPSGAASLLTALEAQEPWSDIPVLLLSAAKSRRQSRAHFVPGFFERANVTLLQRPLGIQFFLSSVRSALRARRRQYQMRDLYRELERSMQLSDMFVSILGHDLRTPINAIKLAAEIIVRLSPDTRALRPAGRILASADRITRMIEQLLDFARIRHGGGIPIHREGMHLGELCRGVMQELQDANPQASIHIQEVGNLSGVWDADRLAQMLSNLAGNAVQHGTKDKPVSVELDGTEASTVHVRVHNVGAILPEALPNLFEAFKRTAGAGSSSSGRTGLGLGLFIAREIARAHGGEICVQSSDDSTTFGVSLPREIRPANTAANRGL